MHGKQAIDVVEILDDSAHVVVEGLRAPELFEKPIPLGDMGGVLRHRALFCVFEGLLVFFIELLHRGRVQIEIALIN